MLIPLSSSSFSLSSEHAFVLSAFLRCFSVWACTSIRSRYLMARTTRAFFFACSGEFSLRKPNWRLRARIQREKVSRYVVAFMITRTRSRTRDLPDVALRHPNERCSLWTPTAVPAPEGSANRNTAFRAAVVARKNFRGVPAESGTIGSAKTVSVGCARARAVKRVSRLYRDVTCGDSTRDKNCGVDPPDQGGKVGIRGV